MKQRYLLFLSVFVLNAGLHAQTFWTETFSNACTAACPADQYTGPNGAWTQTITGTEGADPNAWFVSCAENGNGIGNCGTGCSSIQNPTLHISAAIGNPFCPNDCGAAYDAGGLCGSFTCPQTSRRIESPVINCSTISSPIAVEFVYMAGGSAPDDQCNFWYYDGNTWAMLQTIPPSNNSGCANGQGRWANTVIPLPASAIGNANVKIGFEWVNNDDGVGQDPSIAIDDIILEVGSAVAAIATIQPIVSFDAHSDVININTGTADGTFIIAQLFSIDGRMVLTQQISTTVSVMNVGGLAEGVYTLQLSGDERNFLPVKVMIE